MIDTTELGAGSYPSAPENDIKCFEFETEIAAKMIGYIYAKNEEEARSFIEKGINDDIDDIKDIEIQNITNVKEIND